MKIAFIGAGIMAEAIISGVIDKGSARPEDITASDIAQKRLDHLSEKYGIQGISSNQEAVKDKDVVVLSVKPQIIAHVADDLRGRIQHEQMVLSIMAGIQISRIDMLLTHKSIVRVMPNTPAQIGAGMSVWTATDSIRQPQKDMAQTILAALGKEIYVAEEKYIDMATAVSGSGPAYIFMIIQSLIDAGVHIGLTRDVAAELVMQTVLGSAKFAVESGKHPAELRDMVTSPGGTTAEGLLRLEEGGLRAILTHAVIAGYEKAQALGKG